MKNVLFFVIGLVFCFKIQAQTVEDIDNNVYNTVTIGNQIWMKENLKTSRFNDNSNITLVTDNTTWSGLSTPGYCFYNNDPGTYKDTYGALYNWYAASAGNICPSGWFIPTDSDWTVLSTFLGTESVAGGKMKEAGLDHWISPNSGATNESGFTALPGGYRDVNSSFSSNTSNGRFWSSTGIDNTIAWGRTVFYDSYNLSKSVRDKKFGLSVRCLTNVTDIDKINFNEKIKIYPNPATDNLFINCSSFNSNSVVLSIYNLLGDRIFVNELNSAENSIDLSSYPKGMYLIKLTSEQANYSEKIIKE